MDIFKRIVLLMVMYAFSAVLLYVASQHTPYLLPVIWISALICCYAASAILDTIISLKDAENEVNRRYAQVCLTGQAFCVCLGLIAGVEKFVLR